MEAAVADLKAALAQYARGHGGRFILFGSAARREMRADSDVDIFVDFPTGAHMQAIRFAEEACWRLGLKPDILGFAGPTGRLGARLKLEGLVLPGDEERWSNPMSNEDRWGDVLDAARAAAFHFRAAEEIFREGGLEASGPRAYRARMAFYHAMQSGHTAVESALKRALVAVGERLPIGAEWHKDLLKRAAQPLGQRSQPILDAELATAVGETLGFRHFASHAYDAPFLDYKARPAVEAGGRIADQIETALAAFAEHQKHG
jgi:predicted nucleotidyltransferase